jgi:6-phosphofructokinase 1
MKTLALLVGGGPAPGINAVIAAATIEARNRGLRVLGCYDGFRWLAQGDTEHVLPLEVADVSRIHFEGGSVLRTSRSRATREPGGFDRVARSLARLGVDHLIAIGGDGTAYAAERLAEVAPGLALAHVPKTIDNDLPLPDGQVTFGFTTACNLGKDLVHNLMADSAATERWYFVTVMGRHTGHLALGIGGASGATLTLIPEEFRRAGTTLDGLAAILEGAIIKRRAHGREHGVALLAEGLAEACGPESLGPVEHDPVGHVRLSELELGRALKERVAASLAPRGIAVGIVAKELGYELRSAAPGAFDIQYGRSLGHWATRFLLDGGSRATITIQSGRVVPIPLRDLRDPATGLTRVRYVDMQAETYQTLWAYMIRLKPEDFTDAASRRALARAAALPEEEFVRRFAPLVGRG